MNRLAQGFSSPRKSAGKGARQLEGMRILVAEDEVIVALDIQDVLEEEGADVRGPAYTLAQAMEIASHDALSAAILDLRLGRDSAGPVARALTERGIPFIFYTGQSRTDPLRSEWPHVPLLSKPATARELVSALASCLRENA
jgi:CheY-like chemotaxis protein